MKAAAGRALGRSGAPDSAVSHLEDMIDEALGVTFPASDPIAIMVDPPSNVMSPEWVGPCAAGEHGVLIHTVPNSLRRGMFRLSHPAPLNARMAGPSRTVGGRKLIDRLSGPPKKPAHMDARGCLRRSECVPGKLSWPILAVVFLCALGSRRCAYPGPST
jgi:hypothetical protein